MAKSLPEIFESFTSVMELLRDPHFQDMLESYERAKKVFLVGYEIDDEIHSDILFYTKTNSGLKSDDYLIAFAEFIKKKENEIEAISILLNKPKNWNTKALNELKAALKENDFEETNLIVTHKVVYHKDIVDIISMVKHAARETEPLLSPEERVNKAILKATSGIKLSPEQEKWMEYIKEHLKQNMTIGEEDFKELPVFTDRGGFTKFKMVFPDNYTKIIFEINAAIAA